MPPSEQKIAKLGAITDVLKAVGVILHSSATGSELTLVITLLFLSSGWHRISGAKVVSIHWCQDRVTFG